MADIRRLPVPVTDIWEWQLRGSCRGMNSDMFFHPEQERGPARTARETRAKTVCRGCPVLEQCRTHALTVQEPYGVWGGLSVAERNERIRVDAGQSVVIGVDFAGGHHRRARPPSPGPSPA